MRHQNELEIDFRMAEKWTSEWTRNGRQNEPEMGFTVDEKWTSE